MKFLLLIVSALSQIFSISNTYAGGEKGNGGDAVVCRSADGKIIKAEFFDLFEAREVYGIKIDLGANHLSLEEKIRFFDSRMNRLFPNMAGRFRRHADSFLERSEFLNGPLSDIADAGEVVFPKGCKIEQAIIRGPAEGIPVQHYLINSEIWDALDSTSKLVGISHEFFYGVAVDIYGKENSFDARRLNAEFMKKIPALNEEKILWTGLFQQLGLPLGRSNGFSETWANRAEVEYEMDGRITMSGRTIGVQTFVSSRLGNVSLAPNTDFKATFDPKHQSVTLSGTLSNPLSVSNTLGVFTVKSGQVQESYDHYQTEQYRLEFGDARFTLPPLNSDILSISFSDTCRDFEGSLILSQVENADGKVETLFLRKVKNTLSECTVAFDHRSPSLQITTSKLWDANLTSEAQRSQFEAIPTTLKWKYGTFSDFKETVKVSLNSVESKYGKEKVGFLSEGENALGKFKNIDLSAIRFKNDQQPYAFRTTETAQMTVEVPESGVFVGASPVDITLGMSSRDSVHGSFKIVRLDNFSKEYVGLPVSMIYPNFIHLLDLPRVYIANEDRIKGYNRNPRHQFRDLLQKSNEGYFDLSLKTKRPEKKQQVDLSINWNATIQLTTEGFFHYGRSELIQYLKRGNSFMKIYFSATFEQDGLHINKIEYNKFSRGRGR